MKFFGWGRKKDPPPIQPPRYDEVKTSDAAPTRNIRNPGTARWGSEWGSRDEQAWFPMDHDVEAQAGGMAGWGVSCEDRLQETIRFVFSHEHEGLLAIGTFALDQLAGVRLGLDIKPPGTSTTDQSSRRNSSSVSSMQVVFRTSEDEFQHSSPCKRKELPVFGDHDALSDLHPAKVLPVVLKHNPASTMNSGTNTPDLADTESRTECTAEQYQSDEELFSPGGCGLFGSRSRRSQKLGEKEERKKLPPEKRVGKSEEQCNVVQATASLKKTDRPKGFSSLGRLWRSGCYRQPSTAEVTPEPEMSATAARESPQVAGVPCIANVELGGGTGAAAPVFPKQLPFQPWQCSQKAAEGGERKRLQSFGKSTWACAQNGKWIRTDSEFVVLEM